MLGAGYTARDMSRDEKVLEVLHLRRWEEWDGVGGRAQVS